MDGFAAEVEVAVFEAEELLDFGLFDDVEGGRPGGVEDGGGVGPDLDFTGGEVAVLGAGGAAAYRALDLKDVLGARGVGDGGSFGGFLGVEDDLDKAVVITEVDEDEAAVVAAAVDPGGEGDFGAFVGGAKLAAGVGLEHGGSVAGGGK